MHKPLPDGDEIRVVAPSQSYNAKREVQYQRAQQRLEELGYTITFGKHIKNVALLGTANAKERAQDINEAFADANVKAIMAMHGGWSANEVLPLLDWDVIKQNPKPLVGYSDITVLLNAIYAKTGNSSLLGPAFGTHGHEKLWEYTLNNLNNVLRGTTTSLEPSTRWMSNGDKHTHKTHWTVLNEGQAEGVLIGGNLGTFYLLQGTPYQPAFDQPFILAIEEDNQSGKYTAHEFARRLESILQLPNVRKNIRGMIIGRFESGGLVANELAHEILAAKNVQVPIIANMDFGHTIPMLSLPIGGCVRMSASGNTVMIQL